MAGSFRPCNRIVENEGITFGTDHGGPLADPSERLSEILAATNDCGAEENFSASVRSRRYSDAYSQGTSKACHTCSNCGQLRGPGGKQHRERLRVQLTCLST